MKTLNLLLLGAATIGALLTTADAQAGGPRSRAERINWYHAQQRPWHGAWAHTEYGAPVALVVPPTAQMHTSWAWGVSQSDMRPLYHQFRRDAYQDMTGSPGAAFGFLPTPLYPSHTDQFGVYPVRGPW
jgi:hypothetical protein